jgi:hypothetical protein
MGGTTSGPGEHHTAPGYPSDSTTQHTLLAVNCFENTVHKCQFSENHISKITCENK